MIGLAFASAAPPLARFAGGVLSIIFFVPLPLPLPLPLSRD